MKTMVEFIGHDGIFTLYIRADAVIGLLPVRDNEAKTKIYVGAGEDDYFLVTCTMSECLIRLGYAGGGSA